MNQEREKVLIKKKLPKIEEQLKSDIASFEQRTGRMIMIDGKPYNVYVRQQWDQFFTSKVMEQQQRVGCVFDAFPHSTDSHVLKAYF